MKIFYAVAGSISLALGIAGIFLPLLPTTPFLLLTAWFYCKSSPRLYGWLMSHPYLGPYIRNYRDRRAITLSGKIVSVALLWTTILICIFAVVEPLWLKIMLAAILAGVTWHILSFRTMKREENVRLVPVRKERHMKRLCRFPLPPLPAPEGAAAASAGTIVASAMASGHIFYLLRAAGRDVGYLWIKPDSPGRLRLYGIHIADGHRGKGYAREALIFLEHYCTYRGIANIWLTIDKSNGRGIAMYAKSGFMITSENSPTESGNDQESYIMERDIL